MTKTVQQPRLNEKTICIALIFTSLMLFAVYFYLLSASIVHVVMRTELDQEITKISSEISLLEGQYIKAQYKVSSGIASLQGFQKTDKKIFINRSGDSLVLSTDIGR